MFPMEPSKSVAFCKDARLNSFKFNIVDFSRIIKTQSGTLFEKAEEVSW